MDIAIDPVDGADLTAKSLPNAMSVIAVADEGAMSDPGHCVYMDSWSSVLTWPTWWIFDAPIEDALALAFAGLATNARMAAAFSTARCELVRRLRAVGARIRFLVAGDVAGA